MIFIMFSYAGFIVLATVVCVDSAILICRTPVLKRFHRKKLSPRAFDFLIQTSKATWAGYFFLIPVNMIMFPISLSNGIYLRCVYFTRKKENNFWNCKTSNN